MKTLQELQQIRELMKSNIAGRDSARDSDIRIVVGMATCGIAAGARSVLRAFADEVAKRGLKHVVVTQTGCMGLCKYEPIAEVIMPGADKVTYVKLTEVMVSRIITEHILGGKPVQDFLFHEDSVKTNGI